MSGKKTPSMEATTFESEYPVIPNSALRRAFCGSCGESMRVTYVDAAYAFNQRDIIFCQDCREGTEEKQSRSIESAFKLTTRQREKKQ